VPTLILQPLVENAIRHGIERGTAPGRVEVSAERRNGTLVLRVRDTGPAQGAGEPRPGSGIGLANTRARLRHLYGSDHRFELRDSAGGVLALVELPFHREPLRHAADPRPDR
jgi:sensor histidine kinase YesM